MSTSPNTYLFSTYQSVNTVPENLRVTLFRYSSKWYWFILSAALMAVAAYVYIRYQSPTYRSQTSLLIKDEKKGADQTNILKELEIFTPKKVVENEIEILKSYTLMEQVAKELNLTVQYFEDTPYGKRELFERSPIRLTIEQSKPILIAEDYLAIQFPNANTFSLDDHIYPMNTPVQTSYGRIKVTAHTPTNSQSKPIYVQIQSPVQLTNTLVKDLKAEPTSKSSTVILLSIETAVADKGEAILNRLVRLYNDAAILDKNRVAANTLNFIEERLRLISGELATAEKGVEAYKARQGITDLSVQAETFLKTVQENDSHLNQVNIQLGALQELDQYVKQQPEHKGGTPATLGINDPTLLNLFETVVKLEADRTKLARTTSEQNPMLQTIDNQIKLTKANISENVATMGAMLNKAKQQYVATNTRLEGTIRTIPQKERILMDITRQQSIKNNLYTYLLQKREETAVSFASTISDSRTVDIARTDIKPVKPNKRTIYLLFILGGLFLPLGIITFRDALNDRVTRRQDIEVTTHVPILGEIVKKRHPQTLVVKAGNQTIIAEQIRALRTNLQFLRDNQDSSQVLLFTSSISGEGKSFVSLNLGASLALVGHRTVILEMDLRKPRLRQALKNFQASSGISNYLIGEATLDEIIQPIPDYHNYSIITSGPLPPNPSELLSNRRLATLISELRERFEFIIIDAPPVGLVTDAQLIAPLADATLFMIRHDVTPKNYLNMLEAMFQEKRFNRLNIILNAVGDGDTQYYSYGYKSNGYHYGYKERSSLTTKLFGS